MKTKDFTEEGVAMSEHGDLPRRSEGDSSALDQSEDTATVNAVTAIVREADRKFQVGGGSSRHWVRDYFLPTLNRNGWVLTLQTSRLCPCGLGNEPWHYPRGGVCGVGAGMKVTGAEPQPVVDAVDPHAEAQD